jgi:organic radical activating enzyme
MSVRSDLISQITTNLSGQSNITISSELPFISGGNPLYSTNMNTVYVGEQDIEKETLYVTLDKGNVEQTTTTINAYLATDAKEQFSDINTVISNLLLAGDVISSTVDVSKSYESEIADDVITYTFEYNFTTI